MSTFEAEHLRSQLAELTTKARDNELVLRRFQECELALIGATGFRHLFEKLFHLVRRLHGLQAVSLVLVDPEFEVRRMLEQVSVDTADFGDLFFVEDATLLEPFIGTGALPQLGPFQPELHRRLFSRDFEDPQSVAVLPLARRERMMGLLTLGSNDAQRYRTGYGTDFVTHLAAVVAVCLENVTYSERLMHMGLTDALTGVHNRRYFESRLREEVSRSLRQGTALSCVLLDIDHFKRINDDHGHLEGDRVLREVAFRVKNQLRLSDALARYGGEEFAALLASADAKLGRHIGERVRRAINQAPFRLGDGSELAVTLSAGVAVLQGSEPRLASEGAATALVERADQALYRAKQGGRDKVCVDGED
jgi:diguanylate cyclase (GGDEF)-like protein